MSCPIFEVLMRSERLCRAVIRSERLAVSNLLTVVGLTTRASVEARDWTFGLFGLHADSEGRHDAKCMSRKVAVEHVLDLARRLKMLHLGQPRWIIGVSTERS